MTSTGESPQTQNQALPQPQAPAPAPSGAAIAPIDLSISSPQRQMPYSLFRICSAMTSTLELDKLLELILDLTLDQLKAQRGSVLLYEEGSETLRMLAARGMPEEIVRQGYIPRKGSIAEWVVENDEPLLLNDDVSDKRFTSISEKPLRSSICCPLRAKGKVIGALNVTRTEGTHFEGDDLESLVIMATQSAVSIENARLLEENVRSARLAAVGQTVSGISHCVKNMLTSLKGGMSLGEMGIEQRDWTIVSDGWQMLGRSVNRISLLVLDMLDYGKERAPLRMPVALSRLLDEVADVVKHEAQQKNVSVRVDLEDSLPEVAIDKDQIFRCLLNLATNAVDAVDPVEGTVTLTADLLAADDPDAQPAPNDLEGDVRTLTLSVIDNGCGIEPDHKPHIFQPFFSTKGTKGTGIGLAVTQKIAREHGGRVDVTSELGSGTTFRIALPCMIS